MSAKNNKLTMKTMSWVVFALLSAGFAALVAIFAKMGISSVDTTLATTIRSVIMAIFLVIVALALGKASLLSSIDNKALFYIILSGVAGALSWLFYFFALKTGPAPAVAALDRTSVVFVLILAALLLGDKITLKSGIGAGMVAVGAIIMSLK